jgi:hypothetical protein
MPKLGINKDYLGQVIQFSHRREIITVNDQTTEAELQILIELKHPAVVVMETKTKEAKE